MPFAETTTYTQTRKRSSSDYVKFDEKYRVVLRILEEKSRLVWKHWLQEANAGKGLTANCPNTDKVKICPVEKELTDLAKDDPRLNERKRKAKYIVNVLDRTPVTFDEACQQVTPKGSGNKCVHCGNSISKNTFTPLNKIKILDGGPRLFKETLNGVESLQAEEFNLNITEYDIVFQTQGSGRERRISAIPQAPEPFNGDWLIDPETNEPQKRFDLDTLSEPTSVEEIEAMMQGATIDDLNAIRGIQ